jgi:TRAP-type C4-dicarboxylate transport system substrate-binding protein
MKFKTTALISLLAASSFLVGGSALATTFKVAVGDAQGSAQWEMATNFKSTFEAKTAGKHKIDLFPNGQLGSEETTVNSASMGTLDFSVLAINNITPFSPSVGRTDVALCDPER